MKKLFISFLILIVILIGCKQVQEPIPETREELLVEIKSNPASLLDSILKYTKEIVTIIGLAAAIALGYPALRKKLIEDHVKKIIDEIQSSNKEIKVLCQSLSDKHLSRTYKSEILSIHDIQQTYNELDDLHKKALNASQEVLTFTFLLKRTVQGILRSYDPKNHAYRIFSDEFYGFYIQVLYEIAFFATKIVNIPASPKTVRIKYLTRVIEKYVTYNKYKKFKYFEQGVDYHVASPLLLSFYGRLCNYHNIIILRAAYKIFKSPAPIIRLLYLNGFYFPPVLKKKEPSLFFPMSFHLIGFKRQTQYGEKGEKEIVSLIYANISEMVNFTKSIKKEEIENEFVDDYISSKDVDIKKAIKIDFGNLENVTIDFERSYIKDLFKKNKRLIKDKMLKEIH